MGKNSNAYDNSENEELDNESNEEPEEDPEGEVDGEIDNKLSEGDMEENIAFAAADAFGDEMDVEGERGGSVPANCDASGFVRSSEDFNVGPTKDDSVSFNVCKWLREALLTISITQIQWTEKHGNQDNHRNEDNIEPESGTRQTSQGAAEIRPNAVEETGRSKRKRVPRQLADALNGCLCGSVLDGSMDGVLKCNQAGCETQWVRSPFSSEAVSLYSPDVFSITFNVLTLSWNLEIGRAWHARHLEEASKHGDKENMMSYYYIWKCA